MGGCLWTAHVVSRQPRSEASVNEHNGTLQLATQALMCCSADVSQASVQKPGKGVHGSPKLDSLLPRKGKAHDFLGKLTCAGRRIAGPPRS